MRRALVALTAALALTLGTVVAWSYWSGGSLDGGSGAAAAVTVDRGATPTASAAGASVTLTWAATTLSNGDPVTGYSVTRYDAATNAAQTTLAACTGVITATTCTESNVPAGAWKYAVTPVIGTNWRGQESPTSATVTVGPSDTIPPANSLELSATGAAAHLAGSTVYYRGAAAGSLRVTNAVSDSGSGPASSTTGAMSGGSAGWSHTPTTVSSPAGGPYQSAPFAWAAGTTSTPTVEVTGRDGAGNTATTTLAFVNDSTAPTTGSISYADGFVSGRSVSVTFTSGTDADAGIATRRLERATAPLSNGSCGSYGSFVQVGSTDPASPYVDSGLAAACHRYRLVVVDRVGNQAVTTSNNVVKVGYAGAVSATSGLLSHWRLGDRATTSVTSSDSFTDTAGKLLTSHTGELAATWVRQAGTADATISNEGRVYRASALGGYTTNTSSLVPSTADYTVEADVVRKSSITADMVGVVGRLTSANTFYLARWEQSDTSWNLVKYSGGTRTYLDYVSGEPALVAGQSYRLKLEMTGSTLNLYVDGVLKASAVDTTITAAGRAGIMDGDRELFASNPGKSNTTGLHLDNFQVTGMSLRALDSKGTNHGTYVNGVTLGATGALASDPDTAAQFDGTNDYVQMTGTTGIPVGSTSRSVEAWFKTTSSARQVIFDYGSLASTQEFGLWINSGATAMTAWGWGTGNDKQFTLPLAVNDGSWHQVVVTYDGAALTLYIDGVALPSQTATRSTVMNAYGFTIGAVVTPGDANSGGYFNGTIDEVSLYTTVLNQGTVTDHYQLGVTTAADVAGPTGGSVDAIGLVGTGGRYSTSTTLSIALDKGTDPSGVAATGAELSRATATLTDGSCGPFGAYGLVPGGTDPVAPKSDTVADQACYSYQYVVADTLGNLTTYTSPNMKVDTTAPGAPSLAFSALTNSYWSGSGTEVYYRSAAASGTLTVTATSADAASGIAGYAFPTLGSGWSETPGALGVTTYAWSGPPASPGTTSVTATNRAGSVSAGSAFTLIPDDTAPTAGTVTYPDGSTTQTTVSVSFTTGTDAGSGVGTRLLQRASAPLSGGTCGSFGAFATVTDGTNPTAPVVDTVTAGSCYKYQYAVSDNVGNTHTATSTSVVKVPSPCGSQLLGNPSFENGTTTAPWTASPGVVTNTGTVPARTGTWKAQLGGNGSTSTESLAQVVTIPAGCAATLEYYLRITTAETTGPYDFLEVQVAGGTTTVLQTFSDRDAGTSYLRRTADLSSYAGQTITIRFVANEDVSLQTSFWLDDVTLTTAG